jgi:peptidylprolyl isomerase
MGLGEKADLILTADYGYGESGSPPKIPGGATLIFTVELIQIEDTKAKRFTKSDEELMKEALECKEIGNQKFKGNQLEEAVKYYNAGC